MEVFYILKPDMINKSEVMSYYKTIMDDLSYIDNRKQYLVESWVDLSCLLYDPCDKKITLDELKMIRRQMLTTIKGYDYLYNNGYAIIDLFEIPNDTDILNELERLKYQIRREFVLKTDKNFFKFKDDLALLLDNELKNISISSLNVDYVRLKYDEDISDYEYRMAFLNCIHFPDPNEISISRDMEIIDRSKLLTKKIKI